MQASDFSQYVADWLNRPFEWGKSDCLCFTLGWAEKITGNSYLSRYRKWTNARQAHRNIRAVGGLAAGFDQLFERINPNLASDGDIAVIGTTSYLYVGRHIASVSDDGLAFQCRTKATSAWRIK